MSRFMQFYGQDSSSSDSDSEKDKPSESTTQTAALNKKSRYLFDEQANDEERTIKSGAIKRAEALEKALENTTKTAKIADFFAMEDNFTVLEEEIRKAAESEIFEEKGQKLSVRVLKTLMLVEESILGVTGEQKKKMSKVNSTAYNKMKQKFKKYLQNTGDGEWLYETQLQKYKEKPIEEEEEKEEEDEDEEEPEEEEDEEEADEAEVEKAEAKGGDDEYYDEEYDQEQQQEEDQESDSEKFSQNSDEIDERLKKKYAFLWKERDEMTPDERRWKWVKKENLPVDLAELMEKLTRPKKNKKVADKENKNNQKVATDSKNDDDFLTQVPKQFYFEIDYTNLTNVKDRLDRLQQERMKGHYDAMFHVDVLNKIIGDMPEAVELSEIQLRVKVYIQYVSTLLQTAKSFVILPRESWIEMIDQTNQLLTTVQKPNFVKSLKAAHTLQQAPVAENNEDFESRNSYDTERQVYPSLTNFLEGLNEQLWRSFQFFAHNSMDYIQRVNDENKLLFLCDKLDTFFEQQEQPEYQARVAVVKLNYIYYKQDSIYEKIKVRLGQRSTKNVYIVENSVETVSKLVAHVRQGGIRRQIIRASLQQVYHLAMHDRLREARDLLMKMHMAQQISAQTIDNQIMYNRALVQIGIAAFRAGKIKESHECLADICQNSKHRELLAQKISTLQDKTIEQETEEKKRQMPFHFQLNVQLLECIHFITSMLLEVPAIAANQFTLNKTPVSKNFRRFIETQDAKAFVLTSESYRDYIITAARALNQADWQKAVQNILQIQLFKQIPEYCTPQFQEMITVAFKRAALETYLYQAAKQYKSFDLATLEEMFQMRPKKAISQMIMVNRLQMSIDPERNLLVVDEGATDIKEIQQLSLQYVNQIQVMVTQNEHLANFILVSDSQKKERGSSLVAPQATQQQPPAKGKGK